MQRLSDALQRTLLQAQRSALTTLGVGDVCAEESRYLSPRKRRAVRLQRRGLWARIAAADFVFVGDERTFAPARTLFLELVDQALARDHRPSLALLELPASHQGGVERYLEGRLDELALRDLLFGTELLGELCWEAVLPVLRHARAHNLRVIAGGVPHGAKELHHIARVLAARHVPSVPLFVFGPQAQMLPNRLPRVLRRALSGAQGQHALSVLQNCEVLGTLPLGSYAFDEDLVCVLHAQPTELLQARLDALELQPGDALLADPSEEAFGHLAREIASSFDVGIEGAMRDLRLFGPGSPDALLEFVIRPPLGARAREDVRRSVVARESGYFPHAQAVYLAGRSLNHAAEEAAHFVRHCALGPLLLSPRDECEAFYARVLEEALAFLGSRRANPARPCLQPHDWETFLEEPGELAGAAAYVLGHLAAERRGPACASSFLPPNRPAVFHAVTHGLGYLLGEALDDAWRDGRLDDREVAALFRDPLENPVRLYFTWAERCRGPALTAKRRGA